ncbi:MAG: PEP-CTERM sorting domain-containing protein [Planctomycetes bacterium]|nr:PEP-CTERM sorting domain-containing protein [Planctomycetota bacterium]
MSLKSHYFKTLAFLLIIGLVTSWGTVSTASADVILEDPHYVSGGITPTQPLNDVFLVANYVSETPLSYVQLAFPIGSIPANIETTFEVILPDIVDYTETRYYTIMGNSAYDVNLGFTPAIAADLITNGTSWAAYFSESFQPTEASVTNWLELANTLELGGFLDVNSGLSPLKLGVGIDNYGDTVTSGLVDFCSASDGGDIWIREGRVPEPITMLLLAPGMFFIARRRRQN